MKHFILILKTLFSNNACVECARTKEKKYNIFAIVFAILALFLSVMPTTINAFKKSGSDWIAVTTKYSVDNGLYGFVDTCKDNKVVIKVTQQSGTTSKLTIDKDSWENTFPVVDDPVTTTYNLTDIHRYVYENKLTPSATSSTRLFEVYYYDDTSVDYNTNLTNFVQYLLNGYNPYLKMQGNSDADSYMYFTTNEDGSRTLVSRSTSFMVLGRDYFYAYMYKPGTTTAVGSYGGDYNSMSYEDLASSMYVENDVSATLEKWKEVFVNGYLNTRWRSGWTTTGILCGINGGVIIFMGLMVFVLTRGKNNPYRIYSFWDSQKIAYYASFSPGVIAMALSFFITNMAMMFFVLIFGIRVMWLSMRTLRPAQA